MKKINLIFKTHLDVGFTGLAEDVIHKYFKCFIRDAIKTADYFRKSVRTGDFRYKWTVGSWLISEYLRTADQEKRKKLEAAIKRGDIVWHALPFTMHSELADDALYRFAMSISAQLDRKFKKKTIAAKLTDVPGHTRGIIAPLADAGIKLLHIGINPASAMPDVPPVFRWRDSKGNEILVVYQKEYGSSLSIDGEEFVICMTGDNQGPHTPKQVKEILARYRGAQVRSSTLDELAERLLKHKNKYPVVTKEIGDTWIHGIGSDPKKVADFRELLRLRKDWDDFPEREEFERGLLLTTEHTWGLDEKTHFNAPKAWDPKKLRTAAAREFASSWRERRKLLKNTIFTLPADKGVDALRAVKRLRPAEDLYLKRNVTNDLLFENKYFRFELNPSNASADTIYMKANRFRFKSSALFTYETFNRSDYDRFRQQYLRLPDEPWAIRDFTKPDMPADTEQIRLEGFESKVHKTEWGHGRRITFVTNDHPGFRRIEIDYILPDEDDYLEIRLKWFGKVPHRLPHAAWFSMVPQKSKCTYKFKKMDEYIDPADVVSRGARTLHAVEEMIIDDRVLLENFDAPLVAPGAPALLNFHNQLPQMKGGVHFNLYNNVWGTNFPMWFGDNMTYRFRIRAI
ncbi:MAG: DUF5054 domain-containing protein [Victivallales bacterium]